MAFMDGVGGQSRFRHHRASAHIAVPGCHTSIPTHIPREEPPMPNRVLERDARDVNARPGARRRGAGRLSAWGARRERFARSALLHCPRANIAGGDQWCPCASRHIVEIRSARRRGCVSRLLASLKMESVRSRTAPPFPCASVVSVGRRCDHAVVRAERWGDPGSQETFGPESCCDSDYYR